METNELEPAMPPCFRCPISLDLMRDPVTVLTGISYDRCSIERWFADGNSTCPATMQTLQSKELMPNLILRRLIQAWRAANSSLPSPTRQPLDTQELQRMLQGLGGENKEAVVKNLRAKPRESSRSCKSVVEASCVPVLLLVLASNILPRHKVGNAEMETCEVALGMLGLLPIDDPLRRLISTPKNLYPICWLLRKGSPHARLKAAVLLENVATDREFRIAIGEMEEVFSGLVDLLKDTLFVMAVKASLRALLAICLLKRNGVRAVKAGAVAALVEMLPDVDRSTSEHALEILERFCRCAEGRFAVADHALAIPIITSKVSGFSDICTDYSVAILWAICKYYPDGAVQRKAVELASLFNKLLLLVQMDFSSSTKEKMSEMLMILSAAPMYLRSYDEGRAASRFCYTEDFLETP
ncbi:hypothetical protein O6H91_Y296200 [Diphasiastrum complanatum]|nr:hypothetical protein O6H91_Y296200 [Diphasiastrum complanatum]